MHHLTRSPCSAFFFLLAVWTLGGSKVSATTLYHWTGLGGTDFADGANWDLDSAPTNDLTSDIGVFNANPVTANQPTLLLDRSINGLQFTTPSGGWTLGGAFILSLGSGGINTNGQTSGTNTISANLRFAAASSWLVGTGGTLLVSGQLSSAGAFGLTLNNGSNAGTLKLNRANTYTGGTTVSAGTLLINNASGSGTGTGSVTVNNPGTILGGSGIINAGANNVALNSGTSIAPGAAANTVGTLTMTAANVIFTGASGNLATLAIDISGATADSLTITGNLDLSTSFDRLTVAELATATLPRYQLVTYTGTLTGIFDITTLPSGYSIDYSRPNEIDLVVPVSEASTCFLVGAIALLAIGCHRFGRWRATHLRARASDRLGSIDLFHYPGSGHRVR
jgi:autotransporter-associated beta strand protein